MVRGEGEVLPRSAALLATNVGQGKRVLSVGRGVISIEGG